MVSKSFKRAVSALLMLIVGLMLLPNVAVAAEQQGLEFNAGEKEYAMTRSEISIPDTVEVWVKLNAENRRQIIMNNYLSGKENSWGLEVTAKNNLRYWESIDGQTASILFDGGNLAEIPVCTGEWLLISVVRDKDNGQLLAYINGELLGTATVNNFHDTELTYPLYFGTDLRKNYCLSGSIGRVRMWDEARTADDIKAYYNSAESGDTSGLVHDWDFGAIDGKAYADTIIKDMADGGTDIVTEGFPEDLNNRTGLRLDAADKEYLQVQGEVSIPDTVETWIKLDASNGERQIIMNNYGNGGATWGIEVQKNGKLRYWEHTSTVNNNIYFDTDVCTGEWMLISVVRDKDNNQLLVYINGELTETKSLEKDNTFSDAVLTNYLCFGMDYHYLLNQYFYMNGELGEVRLWSDARTAEEIKEYYSQAVNGTEEGLAHAWSFAARGEAYADTCFGDKKASGLIVKAIGYKQNPNNEYTVTFDLAGGTLDGADTLEQQVVKVYSTVSQPEGIPERGSSEFTGWYKDASCTTKWDFANDTVESNVTIYAGYNYRYTSSGLTDLSGVSFADHTVQLASTDRLSDVPRTFEATVKLPKGLSGRGGVICGNYMEAGYYDYDLGYVGLEVYENGQPRLYWQQGRRNQPDNGKQSVIVPGIDLRQDEWVHLAMTFDDAADTVRCYINGEPVFSQSGCEFTPVIPAQALKIGGDYRGTGGQTTDTGYNSQYFKGEIANVSIWSEVRSAEDIAADFAALQADGSVPSQGDALLASWSFAERIDGVYADLCGDNDVYDFTDWLAPEFAEGDYTMIALPDTQFLSQNYPDTYKMLTQWIADNKDDYNIQAVMYLGDMVNVGNDAQWANCKAATDILDEGGVCWMPMRGNHDPSDSFNATYSYDTYAAKPYFGGSYDPNKLDQTYWTVTVGEREYLILSLGWNPSKEAVAWAEDIVKNNPKKNVIVTTHAFMYWDGTHINDEDLDWPSTSGNYIWDTLGKYENVVLGIGGHIGFPDLAHRTDKNGAGRDVTSILCDAQGIDYTYNLGMMMMFTFHQDSNSVDINWYSVRNNQLFRERNQFAISVPHVGEEEPVETYSITVTYGTADKTEAVAGDTVTITADDRDGYSFSKWEVVSGDVVLGDATSAQTTFVMPAGAVEVKAVFTKEEPVETYSITVTGGSADKTEAMAGDTVTVTADDQDGYSFSKWEVVSGDIVLGDATSAQTTFVMPAGAVEVKAVFTEEEPVETYSITVTGGTADKTEADAGDIITVTADDRDGYSFSKWEVVSGDVVLGDATSAQTTFVMPAGAVELKAVFTKDSSGGSSGNGSSGGGGSSVNRVSVSYTDGGSVTVSDRQASKGEQVTITVKPAGGYQTDSVTVTDNSGNKLTVRNTGDNTYTYTQPAGRAIVKVAFVKEDVPTENTDKENTDKENTDKQEQPFGDVAAGHWAAGAITWVKEQGYMNGAAADAFQPNGLVTRQQLWMVMARMSGASPADMAEARTWVMQNAVSDGSAATDVVTRQQMVTMLYRYAGQQGYDVSQTADLAGFADRAAVADYAAKAMGWSVANGIVGGMADGTLSPDGTATRAQLAAILMRLGQTYND